MIMGMGLDGILHPRSNREHFVEVLSTDRTFAHGTPEFMTQAFLRTTGGDPKALIHLVDTQVDSTLEDLAAIPVPTAVILGTEDDNGPGPGLADALGAAVLRTDTIRRRDPGRGYAPAEVRRTYEEVLDEARRLLGLGEHVIIDATFHDPGERAALHRLADEASADLTELRCELDPQVAARRIVERIERGGDPSEATPELAIELAASFAPWPEAVPLDTSQPVEEVVATALALSTLDKMPQGYDLGLWAKQTPLLHGTESEILGDPAAVAAVVAMVASDDGAFITGTEIRIDGGAHA